MYGNKTLSSSVNTIRAVLDGSFQRNLDTLLHKIYKSAKKIARDVASGALPVYKIRSFITAFESISRFHSLGMFGEKAQGTAKTAQSRDEFRSKTLAVINAIDALLPTDTTSDVHFRAMRTDFQAVLQLV